MRTHFRNLREYREERARAKAKVRHYDEMLATRMDDLRDKDFRGALAMSGVRDLVSGIRPLQLVGSVFEQVNFGSFSNLIATAVAAQAKGVGRKVLAWTTATLGPIILEEVLRSDWLDRWIMNAKGELEDAEEDEEEENVYHDVDEAHEDRPE